MKILYLHQHFTTPDGAGGTRSYEMARRLVRSGHEVLMVCGSYQGGMTGLDGAFRRGRRRGHVDGIDVVEFDLSYGNSDGFLKRAGTFMRFASGASGIALSSRYDLVFATTTPLTAGIPGILARWLRWKPFVFEVRDLWPELPRAMGVITNPLVLAAMGVLEWVSYHSARKCVALSPGIRAGIVRRGIAPDRIALVPNGCDLGLFADGQAAPWRPDGVAADDFMAVFTGTHGQANGLDAVLDAAEVLQTRGHAHIKIVLIGAGKLKPALIARAEAASLGNVVFHDPVPKNALSGLLADADIGLQILADIEAFYYGTSPNKFFDYLAAGLPVLTNYPGWVADLIAENKCGFAVPARDPHAFADALERAAADRARLGEMGAASRRLAAREFDRDALGAQFVSWLKEAA